MLHESLVIILCRCTNEGGEKKENSLPVSLLSAHSSQPQSFLLAQTDSPLPVDAQATAYGEKIMELIRLCQERSNFAPMNYETADYRGIQRVVWWGEYCK